MFSDGRVMGLAGTEPALAPSYYQEQSRSWLRLIEMRTFRSRIGPGFVN